MLQHMNINWNKVARVSQLCAILGLAIALIYWEGVNYVTTYESLAAVFGRAEWIVTLAAVIVLTDIAALAKVVTPQSGSQEPKIVQTLLLIWFAVTTLDAFLTWFFAQLEMERNLTAFPAIMQEWVWIMPLVVALLSWGVQFGLLWIFGEMLESALHGRGKQTSFLNPNPMPAVPTYRPAQQPANNRHGK